MPAAVATAKTKSLSGDDRQGRRDSDGKREVRRDQQPDAMPADQRNAGMPKRRWQTGATPACRRNDGMPTRAEGRKVKCHLTNATANASG